MSIRLIEPSSEGHRLWYLSLLLDRLSELQLSRTEIVTSPEVVRSEPWQEHVSQYVDQVIVVETKSSQYEILRDSVLRNCYVVIPDGDSWLIPLFIMRARTFRRIRGSLLIMRPRPMQTWRSRQRHLLKSLLISILTVLCPHVRILNLRPVPDSDANNTVLDPVTFSPLQGTRDEWLEIHGLRSDIKWLGVLGAISPRKCADTLLETFKNHHAEIADWGLVFIGPMDDAKLENQLEELLTVVPQRVALHNGYLSEANFDTWLKHLDVVSILYRNEASSGILLKCWASQNVALIGGSRMIVDAGERLAVRSLVVSAISPDSVRDALLTYPPKQTPAQTMMDWTDRKEKFADNLLGIS